MKVNLSRARFQQKVNRLNEQETLAMDWAIGLSCEVFRGLYGAKSGADGRTVYRYGKRALNGLVAGMYAVMIEQFEQYRGSDDETFSRDNIPILYTGMRNKVKALEVDVEGIEGEYEFRKEFTGWKSSSLRQKRETRWQLLQDREKTFRSFWYAEMLWLWSERDFGKERLERFYREIRRRYRDGWNLYLDCSDASTAKLANMMKENRKLMESLSVRIN